MKKTIKKKRAKKLPREMTFGQLLAAYEEKVLCHNRKEHQAPLWALNLDFLSHAELNESSVTPPDLIGQILL